VFGNNILLAEEGEVREEEGEVREEEVELIACFQLKWYFTLFIWLSGISLGLKYIVNGAACPGCNVGGFVNVFSLPTV
jgi:hypothetical protein